jgi:glycosyltransferase involved in cell wall biosynthesis
VHADDRSLRHVVVVYAPFREAITWSSLCDGVYVAPCVRVETPGRRTTRVASTIRAARLLRWLYYLIRKQQIALVRLNNSPAVHVPAVLAARLAGVPCIAWLRSFPADGAVGSRYSHRLVTKYVAVSDAVRRAYVGAGVASERIVTIYDGTDIPRNAPEPAPDDAFRVGTLGRLVRWKGLLHLIEAAEMVHAEAPRVKFEIMGNPDLSEPRFQSELFEAIRARHLHDSVTLGGFTADTTAFLSRIHCLVNPSVPAEPFGMSIIEAMAARRPVIATRGGGPSEIIQHGRSGLLTEPGDARDLADAILRLVRDRPLGVALGKAARQRVIDRFEVRRQVMEQEALLRETADGGVPDVLGAPREIEYLF